MYLSGGGPGGFLPAALFSGDTLVSTGPGPFWIRTNNTPVYYTPRGGALDDGPNLQTLLNLWAGRREVHLIAGSTYQINTTVALPSYTRLYLNGAIINSNIVGAYPLAGSVFRATPDAALGVTTLTADPAGTNVIQVVNATGFAAGGIVGLASNVTGRRAFYVIQQVVGLVITLERTIPDLNGFTIGDSAYPYVNSAIRTNIVIEGGGAIFRGTSVITISLQSCRFSEVKDIRFEYNSTNAYGIFNSGCYQCKASRLEVNGYNQVGGAPGGLKGLAFESADSCTFEQCTVVGMATYAFSFEESWRCTMRECHGEACQYGLVFTNDLVATSGSDYNEVHDCSFNGMTLEGVYFIAGSSRNLLQGVECQNCGGTAFRVGDAAHPSNGNQISNCKAINCGSHGLHIENLSKLTQVTDLLSIGSISSDILAADEVWINGLQVSNSRNTSAQLLVFNKAATDFFITNFSINHGITAAAGTCVVCTAGRVYLDNGLMTLAHANDIGVWITTGELVSLNNIRIFPIGGVAGTFGLFAQAGTLRMGDGIDLDACATPFAVAGGFINVGQVVSGGAGAAQNIAWPDINTNDIVVLERGVNGGAPGIAPLLVRTAGVGFAVTFVAGDTSTYNWKIP